MVHCGILVRCGICATSPYNSFVNRSSLARIMTCCLLGANPLSEPELLYCILDTWKRHWNLNQNKISFQEMYSKMSWGNVPGLSLLYWKPRVTMMTTMSSLMTPLLFITTTCAVVNGGEVGITTNLGFDTLRPRQNGYYIVNDIFRCIFFQRKIIAFWFSFHWTHWGRVTHICVSKQAIIASDNGLSPGRRQAIIETNAGILLIRTVGTNFSGIVSEIHTFSLKKMRLKISSAKWRPFCLGLNLFK